MSVHLVRVHPVPRRAPADGEAVVTVPGTAGMLLAALPLPPGGLAAVREPAGAVLDEHLVVQADERRWLPLADVVIGPPRSGSAALVSCDANGVLTTPRGRFQIRYEAGNDASAWVASFVHAWLVAGHDLPDLVNVPLCVDCAGAGRTGVRLSGEPAGPAAA
ncbi:hypothetical protein [Thermomonospora cellulosilytica]|uniref:Uncharacterized protein n=1 Tax=Thermomonospora cellulosilytica TaxID=1411118 RepID=A0A7W3MV69_9ACTN|nr:hypothetical protein [Thermomonospora cellulosilytica]MBA9002532.1 hypothetical protein [Thermomonospora cellulosilytica]